MSRVSIRNLAAHKVRLTLTIVSVLLGTAFVAGSFVFTDTLKHSFDKIFATSEQGIDTQVAAKHDYDPGVPTELIGRLGTVPGVRAVQPNIAAPIAFIDSDGTKLNSNGAPSEGGAWRPADASVNPVPTFVSGTAPTGDHQVVINEGAASKHGLHTGDRVSVVTAGGKVTNATISGIYDVSFDTGGYIGALFARDAAMRLFTDGAHVTTISLAAADGVSEQTLTDRVAKTLPAGLEAKTGTEVRDASAQGVQDALSFVNYILLAFGLIALLVGTFIIYNTFSMIIAQRQRELALLRAIGASSRQVRRSVLFEAGIIGVLGSALGLAGGVGLAYALRALLDAFDLGLPSGALVLSARTVIVSLVVGTVVTLLAARAPARRAARIAPVAAMREDLVAPSAASLLRRTIIGAVIGAAGVAATIGGLTASSTGGAAALTGLGLLGVCAGAMLLSPVLARWVIAPLGRLVPGPVGQLARTNAIRNPRRTAATGFALTIGLVLVAGVAVLGSSAKASVTKLFDNNVTADYILSTQLGIGVPQDAIAAARKADGVASIAEVHTLSATSDGTHQYGSAVDGSLAPVFNLDVRAGSAAVSGTDLLVSRTQADEQGWRLGSTHTFTATGRDPVPLTVSGIYADNQLIGPWLTSGDTWRTLTPPAQRTDIVALVDAAPGADLDRMRTGLESATNPYYVVDVQNRSEFEGSVAAQIDGLIGLLYGLLGLAIVIAILGIVNTLALSVVERRREVGMLRAIGMQRKQVRRTIYVESLLIAVFGAVLGLAVGLSFGALFTHTLRNDGLDLLSIPWVEAVVFLVLAAVVGVLAALLPGARAARTKPLEAISSA